MLSTRSALRWAIGSTLIGALLVTGTMLLASNTKYPEIGDPDPKKQESLKMLMQCALDSLPKKYKDQLKHCDACDVKVHKLNTGKIKHWKHGNVQKKDFNPPAFTPHATPEQLKKCKLCMGINTTLCGWSEAGKKRVLKHELVHLTQYCFWNEWTISNEELFNHPYDENNDQKADGENGNPKSDFRFGPPQPPQPPQDPARDADKKTRELFDKFSDLRSLMTETEAYLVDVDNGCTTDTGVGDWWLKKYKKKKKKEGSEEEEEVECGPRLGEEKQKICDCKTKLNELIDAALMQQGDAYKKLRKFAKRLKDKMPKYCKDVEDRKKEIDKAIEKYCKDR